MDRTTDLLQQSIDQFWDTFPTVWSGIRGHIRAFAAEHFDITFEQFQILRHVHKGIQSVSELAEVKGISRPAISQAVDLLVERGLLTRRQSPDDRRYVQLELTTAGQELMDAIFRENREWMQARLSTLNEEEIRAVLAAFAALKKAFAD